MFVHCNQCFDKKKLTSHIDKAHGYDNISIRMIKICDKAIIKPLKFIRTVLRLVYSQIYGRNLTYINKSNYIRQETLQNYIPELYLAL